MFWLWVHRVLHLVQIVAFSTQIYDFFGNKRSAIVV